VRRRQERSLAKRYAEQLRVKTHSLKTSIAGLSGGNQQKIALAKWLARQCTVLIVDEPTRGVDVGAKAEIHHLLDELACQGWLWWLSRPSCRGDEPEPSHFGHASGRHRGEVARDDFSQPTLMRLMAASKQSCLV